MIISVRSDKDSFQTIEFQPGMNIILAERTKDSTNKDSRNGLGKSTLIEIIHFCLGANLGKDSVLANSKLNDWTFYLDMEFLGEKYTFSRNTSRSNVIFIKGPTTEWPIRPQEDTLTGETSMPSRDWINLCGWLLFNLPIRSKKEKYVPMFRSLISYFIRRGRDAFSTPFEHYRKQLEWDKQVHNLFLLGLDWEFAKRWQIIKDKEQVLKNLKQATQSGLMSGYMGSIGELEIDRVRLEETVGNTRKELETFKVHPQYKEIEDKANALTSQIHELNNENVSDKRLLEYYKNSFTNDKVASTDDVIKIYKEIGISLPDKTKKQLDDVLVFHKRITANREYFLNAEIDRLNKSIFDRDGTIHELSDTRASLMVILQTHGALEEYTKLQERQTGQISNLESIKEKISTLKKFEQGKSALSIEKEQLRIEAQSDYDERHFIRERVITLFNSNSESLYNAPGNLIINIGPSGFQFQVEIERSGSQGIEQMKVFCYDLMIAQLWSYKEIKPGFLIHDSSIFDGVDERQVAHALELAAQDSAKYGFQYICFLNSDTIPTRDLDKEFNINKYVRKTLTDSTPSGCLLGIRF